MGVVILLIATYFAPSIIAGCRSHKNTGGISVLNILLGWLLIPWVLALVWSLSNQEEYRAFREVSAGKTRLTVSDQITNGLQLILVTSVLILGLILTLAILG